MEVVDYTSEMT